MTEGIGWEWGSWGQIKCADLEKNTKNVENKTQKKKQKIKSGRCWECINKLTVKCNGNVILYQFTSDIIDLHTILAIKFTL